MLKFCLYPAEITDVRKSSIAHAFGNMTNVKEQLEQHKHYLDSTLNPRSQNQHQTISLQHQEHKADIISIDSSEEFNGLNIFTISF